MVVRTPGFNPILGENNSLSFPNQKKSGSGRDIAMALLAGLDQSGQVFDSIQRNRQQERDIEARREEQERKEQVQERRDERKEAAADRRLKNQQDFQLLRDELARENEFEAELFDRAMNSLSQIPEDDPRRPEIVKRTSERFRVDTSGVGFDFFGAAKLENKSRELDLKSGQQDIQRQQIDVARERNEINRLNAVNTANNLNRIDRPSSSEVNQTAEFLANDEAFQELETDEERAFFSNATAEMANIILQQNPGISPSEAALQAADTLKGAVVSKGGIFGVGADSVVDRKKATELIKQNRPVQIGEIRTLPDGRKARKIGPGQNDWELLAQ